MKPELPPARLSDPVIGALARWFADRPVASGDGVAVAFSGGLDSTVLAHAVRTCLEGAPCRAVAVHVDHGLRPAAELHREKALVIRNCLAWGMPLVIADLGAGRVAAYGHEAGIGVEEAARVLRYRALGGAADRLGLAQILTAHQLDDDLETQVMAFFRGHGPGRGIPPARGRIGRPLLGLSRAEVEAYASRHGLTWHEDSSNATGEYLRNRVRNELMPLAGRLFPGFAGALSTQRAVAEADEAYLTGLAGGFAWRRVQSADHGGTGRLELRAGGEYFFGLAFALRWRALRLACEELLRSGSMARLPGRDFYLAAADGAHEAALCGWPASLPGLDGRVVVDAAGLQFGFAGRDVFLRPRIVDCRKKGYLVHLTGNGSFTVPGLGTFSVDRMSEDGAEAVMDLVVRTLRSRDRSPADGRLLADRLRSWGVPAAVVGLVPVVLRRGAVRAVLTSPWTGRDRWFTEFGGPEAEFKYLEKAT